MLNNKWLITYGMYQGHTVRQVTIESDLPPWVWIKQKNNVNIFIIFALEIKE